MRDVTLNWFDTGKTTVHVLEFFLDIHSCGATQLKNPAYLYINQDYFLYPEFWHY